MRKKTQQTEEQKHLPPKDACPFCWKKEGGIYVSLPVYLEEDGHTVMVCYRAQCVKCRHIKVYEDPSTGGIKPGIYKLTGKKADFGAQFWPELKKYNIDPKGFIEVLYNQTWERYFDVDKMPKKQGIWDFPTQDADEPQGHEAIQ